MKERDLLKNSIQKDMPDIEEVRNKCTAQSVLDNTASLNKSTNLKTSKKRFIAIPIATCSVILFLTLLLFNKTGYHALPVARSSHSSLSEISSGNSTSYSSEIENGKVQKSSPVVEEGNTRYFPSIGLADRTLPPYHTINGLKAYAPFVFTGTCISSKPVFQNDMVYTLSTVKVTQVIKGPFAAGDTVSIVEMGGRTTQGEYSKNFNPEEGKVFSASTAEQLPDDYKLVYGFDGYFAMKEGDKVLCFAGDSSGFLKNVSEPLYGVVGSYDGKFLLQADGSYAKPVPSETDTPVFNEKSSRITIEELILMQ